MAPRTDLHGLVHVSKDGLIFAAYWESAHCSDRMAYLSINTHPRPPPNDGRHDILRTDLQSMPKSKT